MKHARKINFSAVLSRAKGLACRTKQGWQLTQPGEKRMAEVAATCAFGSPVSVQVRQMRGLLDRLRDGNIRAFLAEAIECAERGLFRAAIVLAWIGAIGLLHRRVVERYLATFNEAARRRDRNWTDAQTADDLCRMRDAVFLEVAESISLLGRSLVKQLRWCLDLRNAAAHPSSLEIGANHVNAYLEVLVLNVYQKFV